VIGRSDRRAVWVGTVTAGALLSLPALRDWGPWIAQLARAPYEVLALVGGAALVTLGCVATDAVALASVRRACRGRARMEMWDGEEELPRDAWIDLGLGTERKAWIDRRAAYREREVPIWVVLGDPKPVRRALRDAVGRGIVATGLVLAVLCGHLA